MLDLTVSPQTRVWSSKGTKHNRQKPVATSRGAKRQGVKDNKYRQDKHTILLRTISDIAVDVRPFGAVSSPSA